MPIYVYRCGNCGHEYDRLEKMSADTENECPKCGGTGKRIIGKGSGNFRLKGEKWFKNSGEY